MLEDEARQRQAIAAEMTNAKLGRETNGDTLVKKIPQASGKPRDIAGKLLGVN
ncbi:MAG: hypothetical protein JRN53_06885 [Nitrososphaerota archaeon]|nr:hypothetical protein [Nitrososphaerota archaeon]